METLIIPFSRRIGKHAVVDTDLDPDALCRLRTLVKGICKSTECQTPIGEIVLTMLKQIKPDMDVLEVAINGGTHRVVFHAGHVPPRTLQRVIARNA